MQILCVDDSPLTLAHLQLMIKRIMPGATVHGCRAAKKAVELAGTAGCDVLISEIELAGSRRGGLDLARKIKEINPKVNVIFETVFSEREYAAEIINLRVSGYLTKPLDHEKLAEEFANLRYPV